MYKLRLIEKTTANKLNVNTPRIGDKLDDTLCTPRYYDYPHEHEQSTLLFARQLQEILIQTDYLVTADLTVTLSTWNHAIHKLGERIHLFCGEKTFKKSMSEKNTRLKTW